MMRCSQCDRSRECGESEKPSCPYGVEPVMRGSEEADHEAREDRS